MPLMCVSIVLVLLLRLLDLTPSTEIVILIVLWLPPNGFLKWLGFDINRQCRRRLKTFISCCIFFNLTTRMWDNYNYSGWSGLPFLETSTTKTGNDPIEVDGDRKLLRNCSRPFQRWLLGAHSHLLRLINSPNVREGHHLDSGRVHQTTDIRRCAF